MAIIKCKMCGGDMLLSEDKTFGTCEYCGCTTTLPRVSDDQRAALFNRGNHFRRSGEFDKALALYENIVREDYTDAEAHWCCALCRFGIEYVEDPTTFEYLPTCHRASFDLFTEDVDYLAALDNSDGLTRRQYQKDAAKIAEVQRGILATSQKEEPFDVFICYKETDDITKARTHDSLDAQEIYYNLTQEGYRVFFSRITLEDKVGAEYEPYIFAALNSAKVMVVIGEKPEYFNAVWVKNEWSRFLSIVKKDRGKLLLPCYKDMDPYDLPEQLGVLQSYDMAKIGFMQDLIRGIRKILEAGKEADRSGSVLSQQSAGGANATALSQRGQMSLEDGEWDMAKEYYDRLLNMDAQNADAYLGLALAAFRLHSTADLKTADNQDAIDRFAQSPDVRRFMRFASDSQKQKLEELIAQARNAVSIREEQERQRRIEIRNRIKENHKRLMASLNAVSCGSQHLIAMKLDGTVVSAGDNKYERCDVGRWYDIVAVAAGDNHSVGLLSDGTVVATGYNLSGQCSLRSWSDITAIAAGDYHSVCLKSDGSVVAAGFNTYGQCNVGAWSDITAIAAGADFSVGLKTDGTVVATGNNGCGQCNVGSWSDITDIAAGSDFTVGLKTDGTVVATGNNDGGQCNVGSWSDIMAVAAGKSHTVGLKLDGTVVAAGSNESGQCGVGGWSDIVVVVSGGDHTIGLRSDGTVITVGAEFVGQRLVGSLKLFNSIETLESDRKEAHALAAADRKAADELAERARMERAVELSEAARQRAERNEIKKRRRDELLRERAALKTELSKLGMFSGKRRKEIEERLIRIDRELNNI